MVVQVTAKPCTQSVLIDYLGRKERFAAMYSRWSSDLHHRDHLKAGRKFRILHSYPEVLTPNCV